MMRLIKILFGATPAKSQTAGRSDEAERLWKVIKGMAQPTLLMIEAEGPAFSKLGGAPELPAGSAWPVAHGAPRAFVGQFDLAEIRAAGGLDWLVGEGRLYAFNESDGFGAADDTLLLYSPEPPGPAVAFPGTLSRNLRFGERRVEFRRMTSLPSLEWLGVEATAPQISGPELDEIGDLPERAYAEEPQHRIGGYPAEIQDEQMQVSCEYLARGLEHDYREPVTDDIRGASKDWRLLLQIDSDPKLKMNWGDGGRLYVLIREQDARAGDFSKTVSLWQTY
jgi:uncharacterized protein YwqG